MDAIIGRYRVHIEEIGLLILRHPTGLMFDLTPEESLGLLDFIGVYRKALMAHERDTDTRMQSIAVVEEETTEE